jgi:ABC-type dipeptide/oligopeptide/nickel transport system permease subunit
MFFPGAGLFLLALVVLPVVGGMLAGLFFLSAPRLRFLAAYAALVPLFAVSGSVGGFIGGLRLARPYFYRYDYGLSTVLWPAWAITIAMMLTGLAVGVAAGVFVGLGVNRRRRREGGVAPRRA